MKFLISSLLVSTFAHAGVMADKALEYTKRANAAKNDMGLVGASDDLPIWNGVLVAGLAYKFSVTRDESDRAEMESVLSALISLHEATGIPGIFARRLDPIQNPLPGEWVAAAGNLKGKMWKASLSHDQYVGYLYGLLESWPYVHDVEIRERVVRTALAIGQHFLRNNEKIIGPNTNLNFDPSILPKDGFPDFLSSIAKKVLPRGGKAMYALQLLKVTSLITQDPELLTAYKNMVDDRGYGPFVRDNNQGNSEQLIANFMGPINFLTKIKVGTAVKATSDSLRAEVGQNLGHIALYTLARAETNPTYRGYFVHALTRTHDWVAHHGNSYWNFLTISQTGHDDGGVSEGKNTLVNFPMDNYGVRGNGGDNSIPKYKGLTANFFKGDKWKWYSVKPLPIERRPMHSFAWQHNAHQMDGNYGNADCPGVAYLVAYWMGRSLGYISATE